LLSLRSLFRNELKEMAYDTILSQKPCNVDIFSAVPEFLLDRHQAGDSNQYVLWNLLMLELCIKCLLTKLYHTSARNMKAIRYNKKPKICFVCPYCYPLFNAECKDIFGGSEVRIYQIANEIANRDNSK